MAELLKIFVSGELTPHLAQIARPVSPIFPHHSLGLCPWKAPCFRGHNLRLLSCQPAGTGRQLGLRPRGVGVQAPQPSAPLASLFMAEAAIRSVRQAQAEDLARVDVEQLEKVLPQLVGGQGRSELMGLSLCHPPRSRAWPWLAPVRLSAPVPHSFWTSRGFHPHSSRLTASRPSPMSTCLLWSLAADGEETADP